MNILIRLVFFLALISAPYSTSLASEVSPSLLSQLHYGMTRDNVIGVLGKDGFPLFKLRFDMKDYYAEAYTNENSNEKFIFVYEDNKLSGIITAEAAEKYWLSQFKHKYGYRYVIPDASRLASIAITAITSRLEIDQLYTSSSDKQTKSKKHELVEMVVANTIMPLGLMGYIATAPISIPLTGALLIDAKTNESDFMKAALKIPLGSSIEGVSSALGEPVSSHLANTQRVLVYVPRWNKKAINRTGATLGFVDNQLEWIGYYYLCCVRDETTMYGRVLTRKETEQPKRLLLYDGPIYDFEILLENSEKINVKDKLGKFRDFGRGDCVQVHFTQQAYSGYDQILSRTDPEKCAGINSPN